MLCCGTFRRRSLCPSLAIRANRSSAIVLNSLKSLPIFSSFSPSSASFSTLFHSPDQSSLYAYQSDAARDLKHRRLLIFLVAIISFLPPNAVAAAATPRIMKGNAINKISCAISRCYPLRITFQNRNRVAIASDVVMQYVDDRFSTIQVPEFLYSVTRIELME